MIYKLPNFYVRSQICDDLVLDLTCESDRHFICMKQHGSSCLDIYEVLYVSVFLKSAEINRIFDKWSILHKNLRVIMATWISGLTIFAIGSNG